MKVQHSRIRSIDASTYVQVSVALSPTLSLGTPSSQPLITLPTPRMNFVSETRERLEERTDLRHERRAAGE